MPTRPRRRRGAVLIAFALLVAALLAAAALTVDLGLAMVERRRLLTATDAAALEGLRLRDADPPQWRDGSGRLDPSIAAAMQPARPDAAAADPPPDPANRDDWRRWAARRVAAATSGEDATEPDAFDPGGDPTRSIGAGDRRPRLQLNRKDARAPELGNLDPGDMVSGRYSASAASHAESAGYARDDFARDPAPTEDREAPPADSFLVRMRQSDEPGHLDDLPGVSSTRATPARHFARGWPGTPDGTGAGFVARATSIADARPALTIGSPVAGPRIVGVASFGFSIDLWRRMTACGPAGPGPTISGTIATDPHERSADGVGLITTALGTGEVFGVGTLGAAMGVDDATMTVASARGFPSPAGSPAATSWVRFVVQVEDERIEVAGGAGTRTWSVERGVGGTAPASHPTSTGAIPTPVRLVARSHGVPCRPLGGADATIEVPDPPAVGQPFIGSAPVGLVVPTVATPCIVPIYQPITDRGGTGRTVTRIVGFGSASVTTTATPPYDFARGIPVKITPLPSAIAPQNASARFTPSWDDLAAGELDQILGPGSANATMSRPLLAPALVRSE